MLVALVAAMVVSYVPMDNCLANAPCIFSSFFYIYLFSCVIISHQHDWFRCCRRGCCTNWRRRLTRWCVCVCETVYRVREVRTLARFGKRNWLRSITASLNAGARSETINTYKCLLGTGDAFGRIGYRAVVIHTPNTPAKGKYRRLDDT